MKLSFYIAKKYLYSKNLPKSIHLISIIASVGIMFGCIALILVLSVFNGFYTLIHDLFHQFDPHIKVTIQKGKYFEKPIFFSNWAKEQPEIEAFTYTIEGKAMLKYFDKQTVVMVKGVDEDFLKVTKADQTVKYGKYQLKGKQNEPLIVLGMGVAYYTNANLKDELNAMQLYNISAKHDILTETESAVIMENVFPVGIFSLQKDYDDKMVIVHKDIAKKLFEVENQIYAIEIKLKNLNDLENFKKKLQTKLGKDFKVQTFYEQHETLFKVMENEKKFSYIVLALLLLIASINIVGSLSLIVVHKKKDIGVMLTLGFQPKQIQKIFMLNGLITGILGLVPGIILGCLIAWLQSEYGLIKLQGADSFIIDHYPMELKLQDVLITAITVIVWVILASWYPAYKATRVSVVDNLKF
jgi:lipoprotein-releasing system permease protein